MHRCIREIFAVESVLVGFYYSSDYIVKISAVNIIYVAKINGMF